MNVPWVNPGRRYRVTGVFSGKTYGTFTGRQLQDAGLTVELPVFGQDLLEIATR